jgi:hypothetical protein
MDDRMKAEPAAPHRILFAGDAWCHPNSGMTPLIEARLRLSRPGAPWRFWHLGESHCTVRVLADEAVRRLLGRDAQRILISIGHAEADQLCAPTEEDLTQLLELLEDKLPGQAWILLPSPSLWPEARRESCLRLRGTLSQGFPKVSRVDLEPRAHAFLASQDPEHGIALSQPGSLPTVTGALLAADEIVTAWS